LNILIYDDKNLEYVTGILVGTTLEPKIMEYKSIIDFGEKYISTGRARLCFDVQNCKKKETVHFDDTLMKRIAKHNKEAEIEKLDKKLKAKENRIKELEEKIEDREQRWKKIQEFVSEIYDLSLEDDYDYYDEDY
jgi:predicted RNase H-like nuclease (RuvC/YqgF family)